MVTLGVGAFAQTPGSGHVLMNPVHAGFVLGTGVKWQDSPRFGSRHTPGLRLLESGQYGAAQDWFESGVAASPEDLFMNRGLYEASALGGAAAAAKGRSFYANRYAVAKKENRTIGPVETLGFASAISLEFGRSQPKASVFDLIDSASVTREVERRMFEATSILAEDRSSALWAALVWKDLGFSGPGRKLLRTFVAGHPVDVAARYTLARLYAVGEIPAGKWSHDADLRVDSAPSPENALREAETILNHSPEFYPAMWIAGISAYDLHLKDKAKKYLSQYIAGGGDKNRQAAESLLKQL